MTRKVNITPHAFSHNKHSVFYLIHDDAIDIIGVPHQQMDIDNVFGE